MGNKIFEKVKLTRSAKRHWHLAEECFKNGKHFCYRCGKELEMDSTVMRKLCGRITSRKDFRTVKLFCLECYEKLWR